MNNSQSSGLPDYTDCLRSIPMAVESVTYDSLLSRTKASFSTNRNDFRNSSYSSYFSSLLQDCFTCVTQSLDLILGLTDDTDSKVTVICGYLHNALSILQSLSNLIKSLVESVPMSCSDMRTFPSAIGHIIMSVFIHCKDSDVIYRNYLDRLEKPLKDLFRTCHELQLTYLMVLEKYFIFDLNKPEEHEILIEALNINLKIGTVVQTLDVKTMAEQWKAFTIICEKYSSYMKNNNIYNDTTEVLCKMIENNMKTSAGVAQEEKHITRSFKVASFTIKILLKICVIFKHTVDKHYEHIVELLIIANLRNEAYMQMNNDYTVELVNLIHSNIIGPIDNLVAELVQDRSFLNCVFQYNIERINKRDELFGYILLMVSCMKSMIQISDNEPTNMFKSNLIECLFNILPHCHVWFNMDLKIKTLTRDGTEGLYEHLLGHMAAFSITLNSEQYFVLEQNMYNAVLGIDCCSAMFSSDLWVVLARICDRQLVLKQLLALCGVFKKLQTNQLFRYSPQRLHLSNLINRLFELMPNEDRLVVYKRLSIQDEYNVTVWCALKVYNLPKHIESDVKKTICMDMRNKFQEIAGGVNKELFKQLINLMELASTCSFDDSENAIEELALTAWTMACPKHNECITLQGDLDKSTLWYCEYVDALVKLTISMKNMFRNSDHLLKVFHVMLNITDTGNTAIKLLLIEFLCKMSIYQTHDANKCLAESLLVQMFQRILRSDDIVKYKFLCKLKNYTLNTNVENILTQVLKEPLKDTYIDFLKYGNLKRFNNKIFKEQLKTVSEFKYIHKCIGNDQEEESTDSQPSLKSMKKYCSSNFDFADIDTLFDGTNESGNEPACKKVKLNTDIETIVTQLEMNTSMLCKVKENFTSDYKGRIKKVCDELRNIIN